MSAPDTPEESTKNIFYPDADDEFDPIYEAELAAHEACDRLVATMREQLNALEAGNLTEEERDSLAKKTENLMATVKLRVQEVPRAESGAEVQSSSVTSDDQNPENRSES